MTQRTLILIDDEDKVLRSLKRVFQDEDYNILTATSCTEGYKLLSKDSAQVIICDQRMPTMSGSEFFILVKQEYPATIRIILSGYSDFEALKTAINDGDIYKFLTKPWDNATLLKIVKEAFQAYEHQSKSKETIKQETEAEVKRLQDEFLSHISHEIRTPLNTIMGFSQLLNNSNIDPITSDYKEYLSEILSSSQSLTKLLTNALDLVEAASTKINFKPQEINLAKLINEVKADFEKSMQNKQISIQINIDPLLSPIVIDPEKLTEVIANLLANAIKFSHAGGKIQILAHPESNQRFYIEVIDNGIGICAEDIERLFKPLQQLDISKTKKFQGLGLGLAAVQCIVEQQGGQVGVTSELGKGSRFFVILPYQPIAEGKRE